MAIKKELLREFIWDVYQIAAKVNTNLYLAANGGALNLRNANMGAG